MFVMTRKRQSIIRDDRSTIQRGRRRHYGFLSKGMIMTNIQSLFIVIIINIVGNIATVKALTTTTSNIPSTTQQQKRHSSSQNVQRKQQQQQQQQQPPMFVNDNEDYDCVSSASPSRRHVLLAFSTTALSTIISTPTTSSSNPCNMLAHAASIDEISSSTSSSSSSSTTTSSPPTTTKFRTKAFNLKEYTNSIIASKDTNVSPKEAYEVLAETIKPVAVNNNNHNNNNNNNSNDNDDNNNNYNPNMYRALDVGAGAGVSTQTLYEMGFTKLDAIDWSGIAWKDNIVECPTSVQFYEMDDERFFNTLKKQQQQQQQSSSENGRSTNEKKYHVIVYNFAINLDKAIRVAKEYLDPNITNSCLLVPANTQKDYWYKQTYYLINSNGDIIWKSKSDIGAWSVQFQPDVTSDTCQGSIWCPPYNGFIRQK